MAIFLHTLNQGLRFNLRGILRFRGAGQGIEKETKVLNEAVAEAVGIPVTNAGASAGRP